MGKAVVWGNLNIIHICIDCIELNQWSDFGLPGFFDPIRGRTRVGKASNGSASLELWVISKAVELLERIRISMFLSGKGASFSKHVNPDSRAHHTGGRRIARGFGSCHRSLAQWWPGIGCLARSITGPGWMCIPVVNGRSPVTGHYQFVYNIFPGKRTLQCGPWVLSPEHMGHHGAIPVAQKHIPELCTDLQCQDLQRSKVLPLMVVGSLGKIWENRITTVYHWVLSCSITDAPLGRGDHRPQVRLQQNVGPAGARSVGLRLLRKWARGREVSSSHGAL